MFRFSPGRCCCPGECRACDPGKSSDNYLATISGFGNTTQCTGCETLNAAWLLPFNQQTLACYYVLESADEFICADDDFEWRFHGDDTDPGLFPLTYKILDTGGGTTSRTLELRIRRETLTGPHTGEFSSYLTRWTQTGHSRDCTLPFTFTHDDLDVGGGLIVPADESPGPPFNPAEGDLFPDVNPGWLCDLHAVTIDIATA